jgi:tetratricopeptide (TPR) repeat protein
VQTTFLALLLAVLVTACSSLSSRQTDRLVKDPHGLPTEAKVDVPFVKQKKYHCGPATLSMALAANGKEISPDVLAHDLFNEKLKGTFQADMLSSARREGMLTIPVDNLQNLLREVSDGRPVIVFQNLTLPIIPQWHYALVVGHDLHGPDIILHSGKDKYKRMDMRLFERSWNLADYWGLLLLKPGEISSTGPEKDHLEASAVLESAGRILEAKKSYLAIKKRWSHSEGALIGLGNVYYSEGKMKDSEKALLEAVHYHPKSSLAWHNLATVQGEQGKSKEARESTKMALKYADKVNRPLFEESLKKWITASSF